jgi:16S rRNA (cytosine1402-N4)-methyltransferase
MTFPPDSFSQYSEIDWFMEGDDNDMLNEANQGSSTPIPYHTPVMLMECMREMEVHAGGTYIDCTFGGGGHTELMIQLCSPGGKVFSFDQDGDAAAIAKTIQHPGFQFVSANFRHISRYAKALKMPLANGILADLGISSHHIDEAMRGFSIRYQGPLDMRMDTQQALDAAEVVNSYPVEALERIFRLYGELQRPRALAERMVAARSKSPIRTTNELKEVALLMAPPQKSMQSKFLAQVFQAIRIEVNDELGALRDLLEQAVDVLAPGGYFVLLTYHSLEDRLVKHYFNSGNFDNKLAKDLYGNIINRPLTPVWTRALIPSPEEIAANPRARSAKLRVAQKPFPDPKTNPAKGLK